MSSATATHPHTASQTSRHSAAWVAVLSLALAAVFALAVLMIVRSGHTARTTPVARAAVGRPGAGHGAGQLPVGYRSMPASKLVALGLVRDPVTGQWMCTAVATHNTAPTVKTSPVNSNPWYGLLR